MGKGGIRKGANNFDVFYEWTLFTTCCWMFRIIHKGFYHKDTFTLIFLKNNIATFIPDWSVVIIKLKRGPTTKVDEKGDELLMKTTVKLEKGKILFHFPENF